MGSIMFKWMMKIHVYLDEKPSFGGILFKPVSFLFERAYTVA